MIGIICLLSLIGLGYFLYVKIKRYGFKRFFNKTFKYCLHEFKVKTTENQIGKFEYEHCEICGKTRNTKVLESSDEFKSRSEEEKTSRVSKIDKILG